MVRNRRVKEILSRAVERIVKEYNPEKVILYGSYAYGKPSSDSDIDLLIVKDTDKRRTDRFIEVSRIIYEHGNHISISPIIYTPEEIEERLAIGDDFITDILSKGKLIYAR
ncbi:MAG: nucleotidyltransferase domain-containing protein [Chloroflexi bacterium]|nr:nucleotidyltransferase domain-containing protein [Chloroflexota bacterium]